MEDARPKPYEQQAFIKTREDVVRCMRASELNFITGGAKQKTTVSNEFKLHEYNFRASINHILSHIRNVTKEWPHGKISLSKIEPGISEKHASSVSSEPSGHASGGNPGPEDYISVDWRESEFEDEISLNIQSALECCEVLLVAVEQYFLVGVDALYKRPLNWRNVRRLISEHPRGCLWGAHFWKQLETEVVIATAAPPSHGVAQSAASERSHEAEYKFEKQLLDDAIQAVYTTVLYNKLGCPGSFWLVWTILLPFVRRTAERSLDELGGTILRKLLFDFLRKVRHKLDPYPSEWITDHFGSEHENLISAFHGFLTDEPEAIVTDEPQPEPESTGTADDKDDLQTRDILARVLKHLLQKRHKLSVDLSMIQLTLRKVGVLFDRRFNWSDMGAITTVEEHTKLCCRLIDKRLTASPDTLVKAYGVDISLTTTQSDIPFDSTEFSVGLEVCMHVTASHGYIFC